MKGVNTSIMCIHYQIAFLLPDLQDQKSLTLRWRSFSRSAQGPSRFVSWLSRMETLPLCVITSKSRFYYTTYRTKNRWRSVDAHFATGISKIYNHFILQNISLMVFWQPFYCLHVLSSVSLHGSLLIHLNRSFNTYYKVSGKCRQYHTQKSPSIRSMFVSTGSFT